MGGCQKYGPFLGPYYSTAPINLRYPKRDPNFDNHPHGGHWQSKYCGLQPGVDITRGDVARVACIPGSALCRLLGQMSFQNFR